MSDVLDRITVNPQQCGGRPFAMLLNFWNRESDWLRLAASALRRDEPPQPHARAARDDQRRQRRP